MNFQEIIKKLRTKLVLSQSELAELLGCSFSSVNRWERGHYQPTIKIKRKILQLCKENNMEVK